MKKAHLQELTQIKPVLFEVANNGTIFLDEVSEFPLTAQVKMLRVIQEGEIEKIGRTEKIDVNVRIIAATNKNLANEVNNTDSGKIFITGLMLFQ